ncbi:MAG: PVC-type heme-binding CxxCH protein, partial [Aureliella sp.]
MTDSNGDGHFDQRKVFKEGLNLVSGIEVGYGGVWIGAAPQLLFIPDRDSNDVPDAEPEVLLDGFGYGDTHETLNSFMWGPNGWLYGNQGVFNTSLIGKLGAADAEREQMSAGVWRYHPVQHKFEVFAHGGSNQWGLDYDQHGQIFMTHCRSFWGQGPTTHVMRNGHYWNQVNGGYARFISSTALPDMPHMKNYLLASARYGHGEGGAGKAGSREVYGGHSHVGTMLYLGDNWPAEYRNHLFTLNLHGHQINHQVNERLGGGYNSVHAGADVLFCGDQQFIGVDLQVGPDGAVYISDWYDPRHCHNPNTELWDRGNGRIYRMKYDDGYHPLVVDYANASIGTLVEAQKHKNHWHARAARMVLAERAAFGKLAEATNQQLLALTTSDNVVHRLHGLWALQMTGMADSWLISELLNDKSEYVRGWAVQVGCEILQPAEVGALLRNHAGSEKSLFVCRYLASALPDLGADDAWSIAALLLGNDELDTDRDLPHLLWQCLASRMDEDLQRGLALARQTDSQTMRDSILWYAARTSDQGREAIAEKLSQASAAEQPRLLNLLAHALRGMRN